MSSLEESIKLLDIGLRKSVAMPVTKMKTSQSLSKLATLSSSVTNINLICGPQQQVSTNHVASKKKGMAARVMNETRAPSLPPSSSFIEPTNCLKSSSGTETSPKHIRTHGRPDQKDSSDEEVQPRQRIGHYYVNVSPRPPVIKKSQKTVPAKDSKEMQWSEAKRHRSPEEHLQQLRSSVPRELGQKVPPPRLPTRMRKGSVGNEENNPFSVLLQKEKIQTIQEKLAPPPPKDSLLSPPESSKPMSLGMKRSFRYRHITLRKEKPLLMNVEEEPSTDEEETEDEEKPTDVKPLYGKKEFALSSPNLTEIGVVKNRSSNNKLSQAHRMTSNYGVSTQTNYSKVTVVGVKVQSCSNSPTHKRVSGNQTKKSSVNKCIRTSSSEGMLTAAAASSDKSPEVSESTDTIILPDRLHKSLLQILAITIL